MVEGVEAVQALQFFLKYGRLIDLLILLVKGLQIELPQFLFGFIGVFIDDFLLEDAEEEELNQKEQAENVPMKDGLLTLY